MNTHESDWQLLLRYLEGDLAPDSREKVEERLRRDDDFRATYDRLRAVRATVEEVPVSFASGFSDRVMERLRRRRDDGLAALYEPIRRAFLPLALASLLLIGGVGVYNAMRYQETGAAGSPVESALGLPEVTYEAALQADWQLDAEAPEPTLSRPDAPPQ
jgi:anti-sigma factor RsiW